VHPFLGIVLFCLGFPEQASARSNAAITEAWRLDHLPALASSLTANARLLALIGDNMALDERTDQVLAVSTEQGYPFWHALGTLFRGWVKIKNGSLAVGISLIRSGWTAYRHRGGGEYTPLYRLPRGGVRDRRAN
jgi:predicted ATPase